MNIKFLREIIVKAKIEKGKSVFGTLEEFFEKNKDLDEVVNTTRTSDKIEKLAKKFSAKELGDIENIFLVSKEGNVEHISGSEYKEIKELLAYYIALGTPGEIFLALKAGFKIVEHLQQYESINNKILSDIKKDL